ncbi:MAG: Ig-like domain-containing protein, partial [bacterium]|nr:Ig-like domain-containing protein [bacterium]
ATFSEEMNPLTISTTTFSLLNGTTPVPGAVTYVGVTALFIPTIPLAPNTIYTATITAGAKDLADNALANDYSWSFTTGEIPDTTPPEVSSTTPLNGAAEVALNAPITATFSEEMNPLTISTTTFSLLNGTTPVPGAVTYVGVTALFIPTVPLAPNTLYTARFNNMVKDLAGNVMAANYVWTFTTGPTPDTTPPQVSSTTPLNGATAVALNAHIAAIFSEAMNPLTISTTTFSLLNGTTPVPGAVTYVGVTALFIPTVPLAPNTLYTARFNNMVKDLAGNVMAANYVWSFTTGPTPDTTPPQVNSTIPAVGVGAVVLNAPIAATFSEAMNPLTISTATFILRLNGMLLVPGTVTYVGVTAFFTPTSSLTLNTLYTATITTGVKDLAGNIMAANYVWSFTTGQTTDTTPPLLSFTTPPNGAAAVALNASITAIFSEAMDFRTISTATFTLRKGTTPVAGAVTYVGVTALFTPTIRLDPNTEYTAWISNTIKDQCGNPLAADHSWTFTTGPVPDTTPPTVISTIPGNNAANVALNTNVSATFSEVMDPMTFRYASFTRQGSTESIAGALTQIGVTVICDPTGNLDPNTLYTVTLETGVTDLAGNALASAYVWSFTTGTIPDTIPPTVAIVDPANLATNVPINKKIAATFSETMDPLTLTTATFTVKQGTTPVSGAVTYAGTVATFTPAGNLTAGTVYTATIATGAKDLAGNALAGNYVWSFTTGAETIALNPVVLGQASRFAVLAGYAVTTVPASAITGDVGTSPAAESFITGFSQTDSTGYATSPQVTAPGRIYAANMADPTPAMLTEAKGDLTIAYNDAKGRTPIPTGTFLNPGSGNLAGLNLVPGLYKFTGGAIATTGFTLTGSANDVWIFQIATDLIISNGVIVTLAGGALAKNIFWQVGTQATLGTTVNFSGTIMADASITMQTGATLNGRALAFTGTVALDQNIITIPSP